MKNYDEMADNVFRRVEEYNIEKQRRRKKIKRTLVPVMCVCLVSLLGVGMWQVGLFDSTPIQTQEDAITPGTKDWYGPGEGENQNSVGDNTISNISSNVDLIGRIVYNGRTYTQNFSSDIEADNIIPDKKIGNGEDFEGTYNSETEVASEVYNVKNYPDLLCVKQYFFCHAVLPVIYH